MIQAKDEFRHQPEKDLFWNESYYFNFFDHKSGLGGFTRMGMSPNIPRSQEKGAVPGLGDQLFCLYLPGGKLGIVRDFCHISGNPEAMKVGGLAYECEEPLSRWRISYKGPLHIVDDPAQLREPLILPLRPFKQENAEIDLVFQGLNPVVDYHNNALKRGLAKDLAGAFKRLSGKSLTVEGIKFVQRMAAVTRMQGANHFEQTGKYSGFMKIGEKTQAFTGTGQRDRSWGVRDWRAPATWYWLTGQFGEEKDFISFNACKVEFAFFQASGGFVCRAGKNFLIEKSEVSTIFQADGVTPRTVGLKLHYGAGEILEAEGRVKNVAPLALDHGLYRILVNEAMTEYTSAQGKCLGISEYLFQL